jgi:hypothetical protein
MPMIINDITEAVTLANSDPPLKFEDYNRLEQAVSQEFRRFLIGLTCSLADNKRFQNDNLNNLLTRAQVAQNSGYAKNSMKRLVYYANAITRLQKDLPSLAADILAGKTRLGVESTIILAKQSTGNISVIIKRMETDSMSLRRIIAEQIQRPAAYSRKFSVERSVKRKPMSVKDMPRYDPDAEVYGLTYTIPTWARAINRLYLSDIFEVSDPARIKLNRELENLKGAADALIELIMEAKYD